MGRKHSQMTSSRHPYKHNIQPAPGSSSRKSLWEQFISTDIGGIQTLVPVEVRELRITLSNTKKSRKIKVRKS